MTTFPIDEFKNIETPFYYYDMELLRLTLDEVKKQAGGSKVHYAVRLMPILASSPRCARLDWVLTA